jgi:hypothetical protein
VSESIIEGLVRQWRVAGAKMRVELLNLDPEASDEDSIALVEATHLRQVELETTLLDLEPITIGDVHALLLLTDEILAVGVGPTTRQIEAHLTRHARLALARLDGSISLESLRWRSRLEGRAA